ncbi:TBCC domain-containing protein 1 [Tympanuchus pallidicinctus]|uniref:TBCC domain-containing protein 1 n=1 Tax=Lagopus leucura TaxID=30410 RepID=UPI001C67D1BE|nr:TBCC domain-containing protein 1 [Lagopus leucura]XP_048810257.1 TBCC domain-containing protein 1 [Lagopus muta]XP_052542159.1 TBCC domain-containing protein 1 [Tympanuchus pallidicinctus]
MAAAAALWPRTEPLLLGALPVPPPARLGPHYLRKMAAYARARAAEGCYPRLSWPRWRHIACGKLQLGRDLAWLYFERFHDLLPPPDPPRRLQRAEAEAACGSAEELERERGKLSVDTLRFLLFLYVQQLNKASLRTSLIGEEWPSPRARAAGLPGRAAGHSKNWNDQDHLAFVLTHLSDMLELLLEPEQLGASSHATHNSLVSYEAVCALSFLIEGTVNNSRTIHPLHELALWQPCHGQNGYSKISKTFSFPKLENWLRSCLIINPFGMTACLRSGKKLAWAQQVEGTTRRAKIACNTRVVPEVSPMVIMSQVYKQTLAKSSDTLVGAHVRIHRCNESFIYLLSPLCSVTIEKCQNSTFVLGPVEASVHVHSCDNIKVITVCHCLSLSSTTGCTFHILTPTQPLILAGNQAISFAPFHTHYPMLEDHMAQVGLATVPNYWDSPMLVCKEGSDASVFRLLPPLDFYTFVIPFEMEGDTTETPGGLPHAYQKALNQREQKVQIWQKMVKEACLTKDQRKQFQMLVESKFYEWLIQTGNRQQLDSLVPPAVGSKQAAG